MTTATPLVPQNPQAPSACQWAQQISVQETGGFLTVLAAMTLNGASITSQIQNIFGTTRLAPYGLLEGTVCVGAAGQAVTTLTGITESGGFSVLVPATLNATMTSAPTAPVVFSSPRSGATVNLSANGSATAALAASFSVGFAGGVSAPWTVTVGPANQAESWLSVSPLSGTGAGTVNLSASAAGFSPGAYTAVLTIASPNAQPADRERRRHADGRRFIWNFLIAGLVNNFSGGLYGRARNDRDRVRDQPRPHRHRGIGARPAAALSRWRGVSATVSGVAAPLYFVSPGQVNVQIPYETGAGTAILAINNNGQIATLGFTVAETAPGMFPAAFDATTGLAVSSAHAGQTLVFYMTGEGDVTPTLATGATPAPASNPSNYPIPRQPVAVSVGGAPAALLFQAIPYGLAGAAQINLTGGGGSPQQLHRGVSRWL